MAGAEAGSARLAYRHLNAAGRLAADRHVEEDDSHDV